MDVMAYIGAISSTQIEVHFSNKYISHKDSEGRARSVIQSYGGDQTQAD